MVDDTVPEQKRELPSSWQLVHAGDIVNIIFGVLIILSLVITIVGIIIAPVWAFIIWWTHKRVSEAKELLEKGEYRKAKDLLIVPSIISMIFVGIVGGILILLGALEFPTEQ